MRRNPIGDWIGTIIALIVFGGFGVCFAGFGIYATAQSYQKQGWGAMVGGSIFIFFGLGLAGLVVFGSISHLRDVNRSVADPDHPWRSNAQWNRSDVSDHPFGGAIGLWIVALFWNAITGTVCWGVLSSGQTLQPGAAFFLIFIAIGVYLLVIAVRATLRAVRYGRSTLHLATMPGEIGGHLTGTIHTQRAIDATGPARLRLVCNRTTNSGQHYITSIVWQDVSEIENLPTSEDGGQIPVDFAIPADLPATRWSSSTRDRISWTLEATVPAREVGYRTSFDVPVFDVQGIGAGIDPDFPTLPPPESNIAMVASPQGISQSPVEGPPTHLGISLTRLANSGCSIHFAAGRNWIFTIILTAIGAGLSEGLLLAYHAHADWLLIIWLWIFAIPFDYAALNGWLSSSTVIARPSGLHIDRGWPLIRFRRDLAAGMITDVTDRIGTQAGNTDYYWLEAKTTSGESVTVARGIRDHQVAQWIAAELLRSLGKINPH